MAQGQCYLFTGPEIGERQDAINDIRKRLGKIYGATPEEQSMYASETPVADMVSLIKNGSLFSEVRLFIIKNTELIKKKDDVELLKSCIEHPQDDTTIICISDEIGIDKNLEQAFPKENRRIFWELFENKKEEWVTTFFRRQGYIIQQEAVETILELVENNTEALRQECGRLTLFFDKAQPITAENIEHYLAHTREESAFTLFSHIARGDLSKSIETLHTLVASKESPQAIIAGLVWCFRKLLDYLTLREQGQTTDLELKKIGLASKKALQDYVAAAKRYTTDSALKALAFLADWDLELRSLGNALESVLVDIYLIKIYNCSSHQ
ncbi:MAG: DNA polymerase III subunit delta [Termitinemataceae bacterium]